MHAALGSWFCLPVEDAHQTQTHLHPCQPDEHQNLLAAAHVKRIECPRSHVVWRMEHHSQWFVRLVQKAVAPAKYEFLATGQTVSLDIGPMNKVAIVADEAVALERFAPSVEQPWQVMRVLQRAQNRSRRSTNPDAYGASGVIKNGANRWARSSRYQRRQLQLSELERCLAQGRKRDHGELSNMMTSTKTFLRRPM